MNHKTEGRYAVQVKTPGDTNFAGNALRFDTIVEAVEYGKDLQSRWMAVTECRVVDTEIDGAFGEIEVAII